MSCDWLVSLQADLVNGSHLTRSCLYYEWGVRHSSPKVPPGTSPAYHYLNVNVTTGNRIPSHKRRLLKTFKGAQLPSSFLLSLSSFSPPFLYSHLSPRPRLKGLRSGSGPSPAAEWHLVHFELKKSVSGGSGSHFSADDDITASAHKTQVFRRRFLQRSALAFWLPYAKSNWAAPDHRESRSTKIVIMTPVTEDVGDIKRRKRCPFVPLSVCCTPLDLYAGRMRGGGGSVLSRVSRGCARLKHWYCANTQIINVSSTGSVIDKFEKKSKFLWKLLTS